MTTEDWRVRKNKKFILLVFILLFVIPFVAAEIDLKKNHTVITGQESLESLITYYIEATNKTNATDSSTHIERINTTCFLKKPIHINPESTFFFDGADCKELKMYPHTYIRIQGSAYFTDISITSADPLTKKPIINSREEYYLERPHIYTKDTAEYVFIENSEFSYLGYYDDSPGSAWGVSFWDLQSGVVRNSTFHHNYFGLYTFEAKNVLIENSEIYDNIEYGLDFHDYSDNFIIRNNTVHGNGNHGIIFSVGCVNNTIEGNYVYNHTRNAFVKGVEQDYGVHGIMLDRVSNSNVVKNNILRNNRESIRISLSNNNTIEGNIVYDDIENGLYMDNSSENLVANNIIFTTGEYGLYSYHSENMYEGNYFENGTYFKYLVNEEEENFRDDNTFVTLTERPPLPQQELSTPEEYFSAKVYLIIAIAFIALIIFIMEVIFKR